MGPISNMGSPRQKSFTSPAWIMASLGIFEFFYAYAFMRSFWIGPTIFVMRPHASLFFIFKWSLLFLFEAIIYWLLRKRIARKSWAWMHILLSMFSIIVLRFLMLLRATQDAQFLRDQTLIYVYWVSLAAGHAFFAANVVISLTQKAPPPGNSDQSVNLLDDVSIE